MADGDTTDADRARAVSNLRKRRGVVRASITRLGNRLKELEEAPDLPNTAEHCRPRSAVDHETGISRLGL